MNWFDEWTLEQEKKKKKKEETEARKKKKDSSSGKTESGAVWGTGDYVAGAQGNADSAAVWGTGDYAGQNLAPVKKKDEDKPKWYEGYVKKGAFEDGVQEGDLKKASVGTAADVAHKILSGAAGVVEGFIDTTASLAPTVKNVQFYADGGIYTAEQEKKHQQEVADLAPVADAFVQKELINEDKVAKNIIAGGYAMADPGKLLWGNGKLAAGVGDVIKERYQEAMNYMAEETKDGEVVAPSQMEQNSFLDAKTDALIQSAGQLAVQIGMAAAGVPWWVTSAATAYGGEYENALNEGATSQEATVSALFTAGAEILTEQIGGIQFGGKTLEDGIAKALSRAISDKFWRTAAKVGLDVFSEGLEEVISEDISRFGQWLSYRSEEELKELLWSEEAIQAKIDAFMPNLRPYYLYA